MKYLSICLLATALFFGSSAALSSELSTKTVEAVYQNKDQLKGQKIQIHGKIVKVNNGIMNRNFLHLQDGTGQKGSNDLTVTSKETANIGDEVTVTGTVSIDVDFGSGYLYPILIENATFTKSQ